MENHENADVNYTLHYFKDMQHRIKIGEDPSQVIERALIYEHTLLKEDKADTGNRHNEGDNQKKDDDQEDEEAFRRMDALLFNIRHSYNEEQNVIDMLPVVENQLRSYERKIRQETSRQAPKFREKCTQCKDFSEPFYEEILNLAKESPAKRTSFHENTFVDELREFIKRCFGIPIATMLLPVLLTLFITDNINAKRSFYSELKPKDRRLSKSNTVSVIKLFLSVAELVYEHIESDLPNLIHGRRFGDYISPTIVISKYSRILDIPIFSHKGILKKYIEHAKISQDEPELLNEAEQYFRGILEHSDMGKQREVNNSQLTDSCMKDLQHLAAICDINAFIMSEYGVPVTPKIKEALKHICKDNLIHGIYRSIVGPELLVQERRKIIAKKLRNGEEITEEDMLGKAPDWEDPDDWSEFVKKIYDSLPFWILTTDDLNRMEFLRCYKIPIEQFRTFAMKDTCSILDRVSEQICERFRAIYHQRMVLHESLVGTDFYLPSHLRQAKNLAGIIADTFQQEDYLLLIDKGDNFNPLQFREFLNNFFRRRNIDTSPYCIDRMELEYECLQTMLLLCKMNLRSNYIERYNSWVSSLHDKKQR